MITAQDLLMDDDGDLVIGDNGDFVLASPARTAKQDIMTRIRTQTDDHAVHPFLGANLSVFHGEPNNRQNGDAIKHAVYKSLVRDNRFLSSAVIVDVAPVGVNEVVILVVLNDAISGLSINEDTVVSFLLNYDDGLITVMR